MPNAHLSVVCVTSIFNSGVWLEVFTMSKNEFRTRLVDRTGITNRLFMQSHWRHMIESASKLRTITSRAHCCVDSDNVTSQSWRHCLFSQLVVTSGLSGAPWTPHSWTISVCKYASPVFGCGRSEVVTGISLSEGSLPQPTSVVSAKNTF